MPRATATLDPFAAIAEPRRRQVLGRLAREDGGELQVNDLASSLGWPQPQVSKHLAVLRQVGIVSVRREGRKRMYRVNGAPLKQVHDWTKHFERYWTHHLGRIKQRAERAARDGGARSTNRHDTED